MRADWLLHAQLVLIKTYHLVQGFRFLKNSSVYETLVIHSLTFLSLDSAFSRKYHSLLMSCLNLTFLFAEILDESLDDGQNLNFD